MKLCVWGGACGWVFPLVVTPRPPRGACAVSAAGSGLGSRDAMCRLSPVPHFLSKEAPVCPSKPLVHLLQRVQLLSSLGWGRGSPGCTGRRGAMPSSRQTRLQGTRHLQFAAFLGLLTVRWLLCGFPSPGIQTVFISLHLLCCLSGPPISK